VLCGAATGRGSRSFVMEDLKDRSCDQGLSC
jgi:hypothetical protein